MVKRAFTLIELLIVIVIIGILAALAVPSYNKIVETAKGAEAVNNLGVFMRAVAGYYVDAGHYPEGPTSDNEICTRATGDSRRTSFNEIGLYVAFLDDASPKRKWDYGASSNPNVDHTGKTDYTVYACPSDISSVDTGNANEMNRFWHGHMKEGRIVGKIINRYTWPDGNGISGVATHNWSDHQ